MIHKQKRKNVILVEHNLYDAVVIITSTYSSIYE
jgi:hypothetical protein